LIYQFAIIAVVDNEKMVEDEESLLIICGETVSHDHSSSSSRTITLREWI
jgi:hypothetical protein